MLGRFKYRNWKNNHPTNILQYLLSPANNRLRFVNFLFQKIVGINRRVKFMVHYTSIVSGDIKMGKNVARYFANSGSCYIQGINGIIIGDNTMFAPGVKIISANHSREDFNKHDKGPPVKIGSNCWLGTNAVVLPGVTLEDNVIVGAGSVVTKSFPGNVVLGGIPARIIKEL